jgi:phospholipase C
MVDLDRRRFLQIAGGAAALTALDQSIARAAAIPAARRTGTLQDVEHIVVLMQENRSFEHYLGTLRGVRGYGDPHPVQLPSGKPVWHQLDGAGPGAAEVLPFHPDVDGLGAAFLEGLPHSWTDGQQAVNRGHYDGWVPAKGTTTMAYLERQDAAFHYALADAFTVCDAYYCSFIGNTDPNRYYLWSGWTGNDGRGGGPVLYNDELGYDWTTYPERLEKAGISWKVYQDEGSGLDAAGSWGWDPDPYIGNYGDNSLLYFNSYRNAAPGDPLFEKARRGTRNKQGEDYFAQLRADLAAGTLPQVSYIAAPEAFSEHSNWPTNYGAWYIAQVLDSFTAHPEVWSRTVLLITYDENDGFFDHLVPPHANSPVIPGKSTVRTDHEFYDGEHGPGSYGMGPRVPMFVVSPWSVGGWVCSQTLDHTSIIRLMEERFGVREPNITPWRRAVSGDLTAAFDFRRTAAQAPDLPDTSAWAPADRERHPDYVPVPPAEGELPRQERGTRPSRPTGYDLAVVESRRGGRLGLQIVNDGSTGAQLQLRLVEPAGDPHSYTVGAGRRLSDTFVLDGDYDLHLHGPHGFFRRYAGHAAGDAVVLTTERVGRTRLRVSLEAPRNVEVRVANAYGAPFRVRGGRSVSVETSSAGGWYDLTATLPGSSWTRVLAGHLETGKPSVSDPALGW